MPVSIQKLVDRINTLLDAGSITDEQAAQFYHIANNIDTLPNIYSSLSTFPSASENTGHFAYNRADGLMYVSDGTSWVQSLLYGTITANAAKVLWTWGTNDHGQLGTGSLGAGASRSSPSTVSGGGTNWSQVSGGYFHTVAVKTDGTLWGVGYNTNGQLGDGSTSRRSLFVNPAGGGTTWSRVSGGYLHTIATKTDGTLWTWGGNASGQLGEGSTTARSSPGTTAGGGTTWSQVSCGYRHSAAIKTDGTLWTWGFNNAGQLGDGSTTSRSSPGTVAGGGTTWSKISTNGTYQNYATCAIKTDGTLWTWGANGYGQLGDGSTTSRSSPGTVAGGGTTWSLVEIGTDHTLATKTDGTLWTWGRNSSGQLGTGNTTNRSSPGTMAGGGTNWSQLAAGRLHSLATKTDGTLWTWGSNYKGQLGDGTTTSRSSPGTTAGISTTWAQLDAGGQNYSVGITSDIGLT